VKKDFPMTRFSGLPVRLLGATLLLLAGAITGGCGRGGDAPDPGLLADPALSLEEASELVGRSRSQAGRNVLRFAPEYLQTAAWYENEAQRLRQEGQEERAREALMAAATALDQGQQIGNVVRSRRVLSFPSDRSLGIIQVKTWAPTGQWREVGPAQGSVTIEPEHMVQLGVSENFSEVDFAVLKGMGPGAIQYLSLSDRRFGDEILAELPGLVGLRDLSLHGLPITDDGMAKLGELKQLRHLNVMGTSITDAGVAALGVMPALEEIALGETQVSDRSVLLLAKNPLLHTILFRRNNLSDVGVDWLADGPPLERLWIHGRGITDFGVQRLATMKSLKELVLLETSISDLGVRSLRQALPNCRIDSVS